ncbi:Hypothetical protein D9617_10g072070 [Elsinoe fawcettii]|nr:Hypothetical protein D9617_10g072070 [Elsinoe fawcettii]
MAGTGAVYKDLLPIPNDSQPVSEPGKKETHTSLTQEATASHALAMADHDEKGVAQQSHGSEVRDLGWNEPKEQIAAPLVGGLENEELWVLVRRFNKQMYHVKEYPHPVPGNLDLNIADEEEFSPDKLRAQLERLYMTIIIGLMGFGKQIVRLRSWRETRRTSAFCAAYFLAWTFDFIVPLFTTTLITLIVYPPSRDLLFPPAPIALVDGKTGGVQKPKAGVLGSTDSATGAPENHKGEAVEAEASNFVNGIASVALASASGKHPQNDPPGKDNENEPNSSVPDPTALAVGAASARSKSSGNTTHDKAKVPVENAMWAKMRPIMHGVADACDTWERFGNALSPTKPFPQDLYRLRLAGLVVPLLGISIVVTSYMFTKGLTFGVGAGFFGDPVLIPAVQFLNKKFPNWQKLLEVRNTILKGVPTNAQLTLTLLRIGEANKAPLPPPPTSSQPPPDEAADVTDDHLRAVGADYPLNASEDELKDAIENHDPNVKHTTGGSDVEASKSTSHGKKGSKILGFFKGSVKASIESTLGADHLKAKAGSDASKNRLGVVPKDKDSLLSGPVDFACRYHGKKGHSYISTKATIPCVSFSLDSDIKKKGSIGRSEDELHPVWSVAVADIKELKKIGGLGWKAKLVVGWALDREVADGLEIITKTGESYTVTAMILRDELFNRLISMSGNKWEAW